MSTINLLSYSELFCDMAAEVRERDHAIAEREFKAAFETTWSEYQENFYVETRLEQAFKLDFYARYTPVLAW